MGPQEHVHPILKDYGGFSRTHFYLEVSAALTVPVSGRTQRYAQAHFPGSGGYWDMLQLSVPGRQHEVGECTS